MNAAEADGNPEALRPIGLLRVRDHCTFTWRTDEGRTGRILEVEEHHCPDCIAELQNHGYDVERRQQGHGGIGSSPT